MVGFGIASAFGGFAQSGAELILARGLQGIFAALMAPAALALLTVTFPSGRERNTAFAIFGFAAEILESSVDLPAFGKPTSPASAMERSSR